MAPLFAFLALLIVLLISYTNGCSIAYPANAQTYIANVQLLDEIIFPDSVLLTISRTGADTTPQTPWCKIMNVIDGSVGRTLDCDARRWNRVVREYTAPDIKSTTVSCKDNCDGSTATCTIVRYSVPFTIDNIPFSASSAGCSTITTGSIFTSFTINDLSTTYISFSTNMVGIEFDESVSPHTYKLYNVHRMGDWSYLIPEGWYSDHLAQGIKIYSDANVLSVPLPCCLCHGRKLSSYSIETDKDTDTQIFTLNSLGFGGGNVDAIKQRVLNQGLFFSQSVYVYDLSNGGSVTSFKPDLCDFMARCKVSPCESALCPMNSGAVCVEDYCGGCNTKWYDILSCLFVEVCAYLYVFIGFAELPM